MTELLQRCLIRDVSINTAEEGTRIRPCSFSGNVFASIQSAFEKSKKKPEKKRWH